MKFKSSEVLSGYDDRSPAASPKSGQATAVRVNRSPGDCNLWLHPFEGGEARSPIRHGAKMTLQTVGSKRDMHPASHQQTVPWLAVQRMASNLRKIFQPLVAIVRQPWRPERSKGFSRMKNF